MMNKAELRVVLHHDRRYAVVVYATLENGELYSGPRLALNPEIFRSSYHASGKTSLRTPTGRSWKQNIPVGQIRGKMKLGSTSGDPRMLDWTYRPKRDTARRRTLVLEYRDLPKPSWTVDLWAFEGGCTDLTGEVLDDYPPHGVVVATVHMESSDPQLLAIVWTLRPEAWVALERSVLNR